MINIYRNYSLLLVVFLHSCISILFYSHQQSFAVFNFIFHYIHPASILSAISGYLFFKSFEYPHDNINLFVKEKYFNRIKSIFIPYIFWLTVLFVFNNGLINILSSLGFNVSEGASYQISALNYIKSFFYPKIAFSDHLWYLNNLVIAFVFSPVLIMVRNNVFLIISIFLFILISYYFVPGDINEDSILRFKFVAFFYMGAIIGLNKQYLYKGIENWKAIILICLVILILGKVINEYYEDEKIYFMLNNIFMIIILFFISYKAIVFFKINNTINYHRSEHFLLYIIHPLLISIIGKILSKTGIVATLSNTFLVIIGGIIITFVVKWINHNFYLLLSKYFPSFTRKIL